MNTIAFEQFTGAIPLYDRRQLPNGVATNAVNCRFERGTIEALHEPSDVKGLSSTTHNVVFHNGREFEFSDGFSFVPSPTVGATDRFYYTDNSGVPKKSSTSIYPAWRGLGVPAPLNPITATGGNLSGTNIIANVSYYYTYVTDWGEESAPSPQSAVFEVYDEMNVTLSGMSAGGIANQAISKKRIYRLNAGSTGAEYQFVAEIPASTTTYIDTMQSADLGEICPTETWIEPPANIKGLIYIGNGCIAGFFGNTVCISEPFAPYAFPLQNQFSVTDTIVGLGHFGQTLVILTTGQPALLNGSDPRSMAQENIPDVYPCVSAKSIVSTRDTVYFASHDGLYTCTSNGISKITTLLYREDDWRELVPQNIIGIVYNDRYYGFLADSGDGFVVDLVGTSVGGETVQTIVTLDFGSQVQVKGVAIDGRDGNLYLVATQSGQTRLLRYDSGVNLLTAKWQSGEAFLGRRGNVGAALVQCAGTGTITVSSDPDARQITSSTTVRFSAAEKVQTVWFDLEGFEIVYGVYLGGNIKNVMYPGQREEDTQDGD